MNSALKKGIVFWVAVILIPVACSVEKRYRMLSFFFDGVPDPFADSLSVESDTVLVPEEDSSTFFAHLVKPEFLVHQPYRDRECSMCHEQGSMSNLSTSQPDLCYSCHTNFSEIYSNEHGPSVGGYCTQCHNPHRSKNESLLERQGLDLCLNCHGSDQFFESVFHYPSDELRCDNCHDPHGGNEHSLLRKGACYHCHDSFAEQYEIVHGPVSWGQCSKCHIPHRKGTDKLLVKQGRDLCFSCHDASLLLEGDTHSYLEDGECIECHNPHGGDDRFMFN